jgi:hypothetical protein
MTYEVGKATPCLQDETDPNTIIEGTTITRVEVNGNDREPLGNCWYVRVATSEDKFYGFAQQSPDYNGRLAALHEGIVKAIPDVDESEESGIVSLDVDDPLKLGTTPGRVALWVAGTDDADDLIGYVEEPVDEDDVNQYILVRMGTK